MHGSVASCGGSDVEVGAEALYRFIPDSVFSSWLGFGLGYEWLSGDASSRNGNLAASETLKGFPFPLVHLQVGEATCASRRSSCWVRSSRPRSAASSA